ncbi:conserved hypothetical protein [Flavobacterium psychrophilum]|uniref:hypothetical protein n=1 Tax=Flavobacterium psychrophilum TaxID=96345 RepID=UPI000B7C190B|nr:hypothetical protein [Flavobacterium psychrophilum]SNB22499.1 conserved hypothetical protein [Flavobacterium psychrophilum]
MENSFFNKAHKELVDISTIRNNNLESSEFGLLHHFVFYFNCNLEKSTVDLYIENNFESLKKSFQSVRKTFVIVNNQTVSDSEIQTLQYYFPTLQVSNNHYNTSQSLLDYFNYTGAVQIGLLAYNNTRLYYNPEISIIEINTNSNNLDQFFDDYFNHLKSNNGFVFEPVIYETNKNLFSPIIIEPDEIEFDDESKAEVQLVLDKLNDIRNKGNFVALLPILEKHLQDQKQNNTKLSQLYIDQEYKIWLVDYDLEVKMSHLTKSIYFLFLVSENGIRLTELWTYKKQLTTIYLSISNQENLDKMLQSIDLLISDKNAIYVHLSRIKATFHKLVHNDIAEKYCIQGAKEEPKSIKIDRSFTNIGKYKQVWFP